MDIVLDIVLEIVLCIVSNCKVFSLPLLPLFKSRLGNTSYHARNIRNPHKIAVFIRLINKANFLVQLQSNANNIDVNMSNFCNLINVVRDNHVTYLPGQNTIVIRCF